MTGALRRAAMMFSLAAVAQGHTLGALLFNGFEQLDVFGPFEMFFAATNQASADFEVVVCSDDNPAIPDLPQQTFGVARTYALNDCPPLDVFMVPGGFGTRAAVQNATLVEWVGRMAGITPHVFSVCTGASLLAKSGVLDGHRATSNKHAFQWVASQGPAVEWVCEARWVADGKFLTTSGVAAGTDGALALIAQLQGQPVAEQAARWAEYEWNQNASVDPFCRACHGANCTVECAC